LHDRFPHTRRAYTISRYSASLSQNIGTFTALTSMNTGMHRSYTIILFGLLLFVALSFSACRNDKNESAMEFLLGRWELVEAFRNGRPTSSLENLFFEFQDEGRMITNLLGEEESATYQLSKTELRQRDSQIDVNYAIEELTDSTLMLSTQLRGYAFRFVLRKQEYLQ
jgi:hypothetical protein